MEDFPQNSRKGEKYSGPATLALYGALAILCVVVWGLAFYGAASLIEDWQQPVQQAEGEGR